MRQREPGDRADGRSAHPDHSTVAAPGLGRAVDAARAGRLARPADLLRIQRASGNAAANSVVQRQPGGALDQITPAVSHEFGDVPIEFPANRYVSGGVMVRGSVSVAALSPGGSGSPLVAGEANRGMFVMADLPNQAMGELLASLGADRSVTRVYAEVSMKRINVSLFTRATYVCHRFPAFAGLLEGWLVGVNIDPADPVKGYVLLGVEGDGAITGTAPMKLNGIDVMTTVRLTVSAMLQPNWPSIMGEVLKQTGAGAVRAELMAVGGESAVGAVASNLSVAAAAIADIAPPVLAGVGVAYGLLETVKNQDAAANAAGTGVQLRTQARTFADGYAKTLTGRKGITGPGAVAAAAELDRVVAASGVTREAAVAEVVRQRGGYAGVYAATLHTLRDQYYREAVRRYDTSHEADRGWFEKLWKGEEWGDRGVFRSTLRMVLFAEE